MRGMKSVYVYETVNGENVSPYFKKRNDALAWARGNKDNFKNKMIFLMQRTMTNKSYKKYFGE